MFTQDDKQFLARFEALTLEPGTFDHKAHLRLAFLCITQDGLEPAVKRVGRGIRAFAENLGAGDKYHQTITEACVQLIALRLTRQPVPDWQTFLEVNPDLVYQAKEVLLQHYSRSGCLATGHGRAFLSLTGCLWRKPYVHHWSSRGPGPPLPQHVTLL